MSPPSPCRPRAFSRHSACSRNATGNALDKSLRSVMPLAALLASWPSASVHAGEPQAPLEVSSVADRVLAARPGDSLLLVVGDRITTARIDRGGIASRNVTLRLTGARLRGQVGGQRAELELENGRVSGTIASSEV